MVQGGLRDSRGSRALAYAAQGIGPHVEGAGGSLRAAAGFKSIAGAFRSRLRFGHSLCHLCLQGVQVEARAALHRRKIEEGPDFPRHGLLGRSNTINTSRPPFIKNWCPTITKRSSPSVLILFSSTIQPRETAEDAGVSSSGQSSRLTPGHWPCHKAGFLAFSPPAAPTRPGPE